MKTLLAKVRGARVYPHKRVLVAGYALELIRLHLFVTLNNGLAANIRRYHSSVNTWLHILLPLGDDAQIAKSGELPPKALVRVDAVRKARLTNLYCSLDCLFTKVDHPYHHLPVSTLLFHRA